MVNIHSLTWRRILGQGAVEDFSGYDTLGYVVHSDYQEIDGRPFRAY